MPSVRRHRRISSSSFYRTFTLRRRWLKFLVKRRTRLPFYFILMAIIVCQWYINLAQPALGGTAKIKRLEAKYKEMMKRLHGLEHQLKMLSFKFTFRERVNAIAMQKHQEHVNPTGPILDTPSSPLSISEKELSQRSPVVVNIHCSVANLKFFLESFREGLENTKRSVICIFALNCCEATTEWLIRVAAMVNDFDGCPVTFVWNVTESRKEKNLRFRRRHRKIEELQQPKLRWWFFFNKVFQNGVKEGVLFNGMLRDFENDILFIDCNVILSPDFLQVASIARKMKTTLPNITQFSLGIWAGHNLINAHPDSFAVRVSRDYHGIVYGMNKSNWQRLSDIQEYFLDDLNPIWTESVANAISFVSSGQGVKTIVPTLSRYWLMSPKRNASLLPRSSFPPWLLLSVPISVNATKVNVGVRDSLGFLCRSIDTLNDATARNAICYCSFWTWQKTQLNEFPRCYPQANDDCLDSY